MTSVAGMGDISRKTLLAESKSGKKGRASCRMGADRRGGSGASVRGLYPVNIHGVS